MDLLFPFSKALIAKLDSLKPLFTEDTARMEETEANLDENEDISEQALQEQVRRFSNLADQNITEGVTLEAMKKYLENLSLDV
jgi:hypothetical protein